MNPKNQEFGLRKNIWEITNLYDLRGENLHSFAEIHRCSTIFLCSLPMCAKIRQPAGACWMVSVDGDGENPLLWSLTAQKREGGRGARHEVTRPKHFWMRKVARNKLRAAFS